MAGGNGGDGRDLVAQRRQPRGGRARAVGDVVACAGIEHVERDRRTLGAETDHVTVLQGDVAGDGSPVDERAVLAAQVPEQARVALPDDRCVAGGNVEVALGVEARVREGMPAQPDVGLAEDLDLSGTRAGQKPKLDLHGLRRTRYRYTARPTSTPAPTIATMARQRARLAGSGGRLPRYTGTGSVLVSVSIRG